MKTFTISYYPVWSQFTVESTTVKANNVEQAEARFWGSSLSDNAQYIIRIDW